MKPEVNVLVLTGYGLNCDTETAYGFELAGAKTERIHINSLIDGSVSLDNFQILVFGGGFSWGDDHGAGVIQAVRLKNNIGDQLLSFVDKGNLVLGICNGFQTLVNLGLLPGFNGDYTTRSVALTFNDCGNFRDDWVYLKTDPESPCVFTRGLDQLELPIRHGEGKFYAEKPVIDRLIQNNQIPLRYALPDSSPAKGQFPWNPNGSIYDIAGICDTTGRIFGLMPHPEAFNHPANHPDWSRNKEAAKRKGEQINTGLTPGIMMLKNAVDFIC
ncbi:CobB/CobQ-like glutamine amidotransferase domain-containing protein [Desulfonema limicola]|uniref:CobB/CobQ-like glutamine amidotransferase domain-containing protein n=1 Tax=Desulfonema limicola TaxID=45656 RepID=A0A975B615_9BACT|nr:phosphoribosylformylglycinamidine synthase subunit PurQ [Desulfonema limicola]QTA79444.1 CobB/CobQ-like glutamine amidotransferase domain-containing protein [Desulfonema limicola]